MSFESWAEDEFELVTTGLTQRRPSPHQSLFKYVSLGSKPSWEYLERTLMKFELVGATAKSLNDPFELSPILFDDLRPVKLAKKPNADRAIKFGEDLFADGAIRELRLRAKNRFEKLQEYGRVIAFCERFDSPLLWSHYANSYQGACLHFLGRAFPRHRADIGYVSYSDHRPIYPLSLALALDRASSSSSPRRSRLLAESQRAVYFCKASDWAYEKEIRIIYNVNRSTSITFEEDGLVSIIVGPRMSPESVQKIQELVERSPMPHLKVRQAKLSTTSFAVEIDGMTEP